MKGRSRSGNTGNGDGTFVQGNDIFYNGKPQAGSLRFLIRSGSPVIAAEEIFLILFRDSFSVVGDGYLNHSPLLADMQGGLGIRFPMEKGIQDKVPESTRQESGIEGKKDGFPGAGKENPALFIFGGIQDINDKLPEKTDKVLLLFFHGDHSVLQLISQLQVIDERFHVGRVFQDNPRIMAVLLLLGGIGLLHELRIAPDGGQGSFQVMGDVGDPFFLHPFGLFPQPVAGADFPVQPVHAVVEITEDAASADGR